MAIFRPSALVQGISGSVGGVTFVNARGSKVVRFRPPKLRKNQTLPVLDAIKSRAAFDATVKAWADLSEANRQNWRAAAPQFTFPNRLGQHRPISGFQFFIKVNFNTALAGDTIALLGYDPDPVVSITTVALGAQVSAGLNVLVDYDSAPPEIPFFFFGALDFKETTQSFVRDWKFFHQFTPPDGLNTNIIDPWEAIFGPLRLDQLIRLRRVPKQEGALPQQEIIRSLVVAA